MWHKWGTEEVQRWFWWGNPDKNISLGRPSFRWVDNIKMSLQKVGWRA
jgi:hypothetical protein